MSNAINLNRWPSALAARKELVVRGYTPAHSHPNKPELWMKKDATDMVICKSWYELTEEYWWTLRPYPHDMFKEKTDVHSGGTEDSAANEGQENT